MKKVSTASFIIGVILIVASIVLFVFGIQSVNTPYAYSRSINGYTYTKISYSIFVTGIVNGFMMILFGGISFLGGFLSFILAAITHGPKFPKPGCGPKPKKCPDAQYCNSSEPAGNNENLNSTNANTCDCSNTGSNEQGSNAEY